MSSRITTQAFYEELRRLSERRANDSAQMRSTLHSIQNKVDHLHGWAFGHDGKKGMDQRFRALEDLHLEERGGNQIKERIWRVAQQLIAFTIGILGAIIGALL